LPEAPTAVRVLGFTEKPDAATAQAYLATGEYRWNAGMFLIRAEVLLGHLAEQRPALHAGLRSLAAVWDTPEREQALVEIWPGLERVAIDHAIAEPVAAAGGVAMVPGDFGWDDIGGFGSLAALLPAAAEDGGRVLGDHGLVIRIDATNAMVVPGSNRQVVILGLDDVVVVDTPDAVLVTTRDRVQDVKHVVAALRELGRDDLL
jgi:mannose-1-phosphate guanylyltransferase